MKSVTIYLEDWQRRMVKDVLGVPCRCWTVPLSGGGGVRYKVGGPVRDDVKRMYLTEWQMREIKDTAGEECQYVELDKGVITKYGMPPRAMVKAR